MKKIYLILSYSGSTVSSIIKFYKKQQYSHISISLNPSLKYMFSFGRKNPYIAFIGGFVEEQINVGTYKRFNKTICKVYELEVPTYNYNKLKKVLNEFKVNKSLYKYNILGVLLIPFNIPIKRKNHYYCSEFIRFLLMNSKIKKDLPPLLSPEELINQIENKQLIYKGLLNSYNIN